MFNVAIKTWFPRRSRAVKSVFRCSCRPPTTYFAAGELPLALTPGPGKRTRKRTERGATGGEDLPRYSAMHRGIAKRAVPWHTTLDLRWEWPISDRLGPFVCVRIIGGAEMAPGRVDDMTSLLIPPR